LFLTQSQIADCLSNEEVAPLLTESVKYKKYIRRKYAAVRFTNARFLTRRFGRFQTAEPALAMPPARYKKK